jgi:hypothetical protein
VVLHLVDEVIGGTKPIVIILLVVILLEVTATDAL